MIRLRLLAALSVVALAVVVELPGAQAQGAPPMVTLGQWMRIAARAGDAGYIKGLLDYGVPPDLQDPNGFSSLMWGAYFGRYDVVVLLIDHGADLDIRNFKNDTSLMWASFGGFLDVVKELVENNASIDAQEVEGFTAMMGAAAQGHYDVVKYLLQQGGDKELYNVLGHAALTIASALDHTDVVGILGDTVHINYQDNKLMTPLHHTAASSHPLTLKKVLEFCPNASLLDQNNKTALELAEDIGFDAGVQMILEYLGRHCRRFGERYEVNKIIYQGCEVLLCHCHSGWRLTTERNPLCSDSHRGKNLILSRQKHKVTGDIDCSQRKCL